jgi:hypothetical protein
VFTVSPSERRQQRTYLIFDWVWVPPMTGKVLERGFCAMPVLDLECVA